MYRRLIVPGALAFALALAVPATAADYSPGAPGIGDPYYPVSGNGGYDVRHYGLDLTYHPDSDLLEGTATIRATATQDLSRFDLDFGLPVKSVTVNGRSAAHHLSGDQELEVTPAAGLRDKARFTAVVRYAGKPSDLVINGFTSWARTPDGAVAAQEPESSVWWYPANDHPLDKATYDISVSVPKGLDTVSNGVLTGQHTRNGWTRYDWRSDKPQATYLTTLAIGKFDIHHGVTDDGIPVTTAYSKDLDPAEAAGARASVERTAEVVEWLETLYGRYPFSAAGGYVPNVTSGFALETQTRPMYSPSIFKNGENISVVAHELAHQWYGDSVSVHGWKDIWVNEGFAAYTEWLWSEQHGGPSARESADETYAAHPADDAFWTVLPGDPGPDNQFDAAVYDRGAMAIQALRDEVGDKAFFKLLKKWPRLHRYGNGSVAAFRAYAERETGKDLGALFETWLFTPERPASPGGAA
ncbi:M1 family metallopeptidase [Streptomyces sp. NPDC050560]|uniref:M1 family metallopeptidase n=1 Tax=Streptomyces sp. NPDC050560 TaxID=3365630 RepID=UPI0037ADF8BE